MSLSAIPREKLAGPLDASEHDTAVLPAFEAMGEGEPSPPCATTLARAQHWLDRGETVVIPTETVYGLAARATEAAAVARIYAVKGRPVDNPLIVHVSGAGELAPIGAVPTPLALQLSEAFWPGPLTLVLDSQGLLPWVSAGLDSVAVRCPSHPFASALIQRVGPLAAPSANLSGRPSPTSAQHALADLAGRVPLIVDAGSVHHGLESTVVDARGTEPVLLRPGTVTSEQIESCTGRQLRRTTGESAPRSPGMKYRHYSPRAELWLYPRYGEAPGRIERDARTLRRSGARVAVISTLEVDSDRHVALPADVSVTARGLFAWLRQLDAERVDYILVEGVADTGVGRAVMDRLRRAATQLRTGPRSSDRT